MSQPPCTTCGDECLKVNQCYPDEISPVQACINACGSEDPTQCYNNCIRDFATPSMSCLNGECTEGCVDNTDCQALYGESGKCSNGTCTPMGSITGSCERFGPAFTDVGGICTTMKCTGRNSCPDGYVCDNGLCVLPDDSDYLKLLLIIVIVIIAIIIASIGLYVLVKKIRSKKSDNDVDVPGDNVNNSPYNGI